MPDRNQKLIILYVEDTQALLYQYLAFIRSEWSPESQGVRSREEARKLLESGFKPDLVIHDCHVLAFATDNTATDTAGDELYALYYLLGLDDRVVVLSGGADRLGKEPYLSRPPLGLVHKPVGEDKIREAVQIWRDRHEGATST